MKNILRYLLLSTITITTCITLNISEAGFSSWFKKNKAEEPKNKTKDNEQEEKETDTTTDSNTDAKKTDKKEEPKNKKRDNGQKGKEIEMATYPKKGTKDTDKKQEDKNEYDENEKRFLQFYGEALEFFKEYFKVDDSAKASKKDDDSEGIIVFKKGLPIESVTQNDIANTVFFYASLNPNIPYQKLVLLAALSHAYNNIMDYITSKEGISKNKDIQYVCDKLKLHAFMSAFLYQKALKLLTYEEGKKIHNILWQDQINDPKSGNLVFGKFILSNNKEFLNRIKDLAQKTATKGKNGFEISVTKQAKKGKTLIKNEEDLIKVIKKIQDEIQKEAKKTGTNKNIIISYPVQGIFEKELPTMINGHNVFDGEVVKEIMDGIKTIKHKNYVMGPYEISKGLFALYFAEDKHKATEEDKPKFNEVIFNGMKSDPRAIEYLDQEYFESLVKKYNVKMYDLNGKEVNIKDYHTDFYKNKRKMKEESIKKKKQLPVLSQISKDHVIAKIGEKQKLTVRDLCNRFNVKSLEDIQIDKMAEQIDLPLNMAMQLLIKGCIDDKLLLKEMKASDAVKTEKMKTLFRKIERQVRNHKHFAEHIKLSPEEVEAAYNKLINNTALSMSDDVEIQAVKLMLCKSEDEAKALLEQYKNNPLLFNNDFEKAQNKKDKNLAWKPIKIDKITKETPNITEEMWDLIMKSSGSTLATDYIKIDGSKYDCDGYKYAIMYIGNKGPVESQKFEQVKFSKLSFKQKAMVAKVVENIKITEYCDKLLLDNIATISGQEYASCFQTVEERMQYVASIIQFDKDLRQMYY